MKAVIAIDSYKGSLSTFESGEAAARGIRRVYPDAEVVVCPLADGGEGTTEAIIGASGGYMREVSVTGPLSEEILAAYGILPDKSVAVIEMSAAAGITLIDASERNPLVTTTYGVGEMILDAMDAGCRDFIIGIGGSATNDGGVGMLSALGFEFLDRDGEPIALGAVGLDSLAEIRTNRVDPRLHACRFRVACDVKNPLCGEYGCSAIYGPQKGATPEMIKNMDASLARYATLTRTVFHDADPEYAGAGAAGGMGFALMSYLGATLTSGIDLVIDAVGLESHIKSCDVVVTGEGRLDGQSAMGKAPVGVARLAKKYGKAVLAFAGCVSAGAEACNENGIDAYFPILQAPCSLEEAMDVKNAEENLESTVEQAFRLIRTFWR